jgi:hypothetical protein
VGRAKRHRYDGDRIYINAWVQIIDREVRKAAASTDHNRLDQAQRSREGSVDTKIEVGGEVIELTLYQRAKTVWVASGVFLGRRIEVRGSSQNAVLKHWRRAAENRVA